MFRPNRSLKIVIEPIRATIRAIVARILNQATSLCKSLGNIALWSVSFQGIAPTWRDWGFSIDCLDQSTQNTSRHGPIGKKNRLNRLNRATMRASVAGILPKATKALKSPGSGVVTA